MKISEYFTHPPPKYIPRNVYALYDISPTVNVVTAINREDPPNNTFCNIKNSTIHSLIRTTKHSSALAIVGTSLAGSYEDIQKIIALSFYPCAIYHSPKVQKLIFFEKKMKHCKHSM